MENKKKRYKKSPMHFHLQKEIAFLNFYSQDENGHSLSDRIDELQTPNILVFRKHDKLQKVTKQRLLKHLVYQWCIP